MKLKITYGILMTIAFCVLITLISISDMLMGVKIGLDLSGFTIYSGAMIAIIKTKIE